MNAPKISIEAWDPEYGSPLDRAEREPSAVAVEAEVELPHDRWRPLTPPDATAVPRSIVFVDGVRRIDALVWLQGTRPMPWRGICVSYAAGTVRAEARAITDRVEVRRSLIAGAAVGPLATSVGTFQPSIAGDDSPETLSLVLQRCLGELEIEVGKSLQNPAELTVVDGPLSGRQNVPGAVGYVKTHQVSYLPRTQDAVVARLEPGQRSPLFVTATSWTRYSWYLRLPGPRAHPWSGIVRLEASGDLATRDAVRLADVTARALPRFASSPHKDPRAPQNLFPIGGLERELRRRLGDAGLVHRALRAATG